MLVKYIWDFRGDGALKTAQHHAIHLGEFIQAKNLLNSKTGYEQLNDHHSIAFILSSKDNLLTIRDILKPNRAEKV